MSNTTPTNTAMNKEDSNTQINNEDNNLTNKEDSTPNTNKEDTTNTNTADYCRKIIKLFDDLSLDTFLSLNPIPSLKKYPHFDTFKDGISFDESDLHKIGKKAIKYYNSHSLIKLFTGYFNLFEFHHRVSNSRPEIFEKFLAVILKVFSSMEKSKVENMLREICINSRMHEFYAELYRIWEEEKNSKEKRYLLDL